MEFKRIKVINSHVGVGRFLDECDPEYYSEIARVDSIPSPYRYSPTEIVRLYKGKRVILKEVRHRRYEVFELIGE